MAANHQRFTFDGLRVGHSTFNVLVWIVDSVTGIVQERESAVHVPLRSRHFYHAEYRR